MTGPLTLPADPSAPRRARTFLAQELAECLEDDALETAKLLVSELVTNSLVHAASDVQVECDSTAASVTVRVRDADTGPLAPGSGGPDIGQGIAEGGRGLLLVERLAATWGTEHSGGRKSVWFRLPRTARSSPLARAVPAAPLSVPRRDGDVDADSTWTALRSAERRLRTLTLPDVLRRTLTPEQQLQELVQRIVEALGATGAQVRAASGDQLVALAATGADPGHTVPLLVDGTALGTLTVHLADPDDDDLAFLRVAAERLSILRYEHDLVRAHEARATGLTYLTDATDLLAGTSSTRSALALLTQLAVPRLGDWAAAYTVTDRHVARRVTATHRLEERLDALLDLLGRDVDLAAAIQDAARTGAASRLPLTVNVAGQRTFVVILPLTWRARSVGVLVLGRAQSLDAVGLAHALEFGRRAAVAVDNARMHEEHNHTANALQAALLPPELPTVDGLEFAARYSSASPSLLVGGDFYDAFQLSDSSVVCAIGDVCGKGAEAAAVTGMSRDLIRLLLRDGHGLVATLQRLNRALIEDAASSRFCTVALARLVRSGEGLRMQVCLAGHPEPVVVRADGTTELVGAHGDLLGVLPGEIHLTEVVTTLEPHDSLVLYTDGIIERRDATRMFGQEGLRSALQRLAGASAASLAAGVHAAAQSFVDAELRDDLAMLVARHTAS